MAQSVVLQTFPTRVPILISLGAGANSFCTDTRNVEITLL